MFSRKRKALTFALLKVVLTLTTGCWELPEHCGPICEQAQTDSWSPATRQADLDQADYYPWVDDPQLEDEVNAVALAAFLIHEVAHAAGAPAHMDDKDQSWHARGPYRLQAEFLAAFYHSPGLPEQLREMARHEFEWIIRDKFIKPVNFTIEDLRPEG